MKYRIYFRTNNKTIEQISLLTAIDFISAIRTVRNIITSHFMVNTMPSFTFELVSCATVITCNRRTQLNKMFPLLLRKVCMLY